MKHKIVKKLNKIKSNSAGFTLVEMIVSMSIFIMLFLAITGISLSVISTQRVIHSLQSIHEPGRFILESIAKEIRISSVVSISPDRKRLKISNYKGSDIDYVFHDASKRLLREGQYVSPDDIDLTGRFYVRNYSFPERSVVTVVIKAESTGGRVEEDKDIYLQTSLSTR